MLRAVTNPVATDSLIPFSVCAIRMPSLAALEEQLEAGAPDCMPIAIRMPSLAALEEQLEAGGADCMPIAIRVPSLAALEEQLEVGALLPRRVAQEGEGVGAEHVVAHVERRERGHGGARGGTAEEHRARPLAEVACSTHSVHTSGVSGPTLGKESVGAVRVALELADGALEPRIRMSSACHSFQ